jgi:uroporphyrinogen-III synthase
VKVPNFSQPAKPELTGRAAGVSPLHLNASSVLCLRSQAAQSILTAGLTSGEEVIVIVTYQTNKMALGLRERGRG